MDVTMRATVLLTTLACGWGCQAKETAPAAPAPEPGKSAAAAAAPGAPAQLEACHLEMTAPDAHEWTTYWNPAGVRAVSEGDSYAHSAAWGNEQEKQSLAKAGAVSQLDISCSAKNAKHDLEFGIVLDAFNSTDKEMPLGPGSYPVVSKSNDGKTKPGTFIAGSIIYDRKIFTATGGSVKLDRFDMAGVAGSFVVEGKEIVMGNRPLHLSGTFDIPCRGGMLEGACTAHKASSGK